MRLLNLVLNLIGLSRATMTYEIMSFDYAMFVFDYDYFMFFLLT